MDSIEQSIDIDILSDYVEEALSELDNMEDTINEVRITLENVLEEVEK